jgi:hypothetical protein
MGGHNDESRGSDYRVDPGTDPSQSLAPEHLAKRIFAVAEGKKKSGTLFEVYS